MDIAFSNGSRAQLAGERVLAAPPPPRASHAKARHCRPAIPSGIAQRDARPDQAVGKGTKSIGASPAWQRVAQILRGNSVMTVEELLNLPQSLRLVVLENLWQSNDPNAAELVRSVFDHHDPHTRRAARNALKRLPLYPEPPQAKLTPQVIHFPVQPPVATQTTGPLPVSIKPRRSRFAAHQGLLFGLFFLFGIPIGLLLTYISPALGFGLIVVCGFVMLVIWLAGIANVLTGKSPLSKDKDSTRNSFS